MKKLLLAVLLLCLSSWCWGADNIKVSVSASSFSGAAPFSPTFTGAYTLDSGYSISWWSWNFGDGIFCYSPNFCDLTVTHIYPKAGTYTVTFTASDSKGNTALTTATITVGVTDKVTASLSLDPARNLGQQVVNLFLAASSSGGVISTVQFDCGNGQVDPLDVYLWYPPQGSTLTVTGFKSVSGAGHTCNYGPGSYTARVTVTDSLKQSAVASLSVAVR